MNALLIVADDLGHHALGSFYETPHLDQLSKEGLQLIIAYAASPVCSPTRSSILTGLYPQTTHNTQYFGAYNFGKTANFIARRAYKKTKEDGLKNPLLEVINTFILIEI